MLLLLSPFSASAQETTTTPTAPTVDLSGGGFDAHGFRLATPGLDPRDPLGFVRPGALESLQWGLGAVGEYAMRPLVFESADGARTDALRDVVALDVAAGFVPVDPIRIDLSMPVVLTSSGVAGSEGPAPGDLRASLLLAPLQPDPTGFGLGLVAALDAPTGTPERWLGTTGVAGLVGAAATVQSDAVAASWLVGGRLAPNTKPEDRPAPTRGGDTAEVLANLAYSADGLVGFGVEGHVSVPVDAVVREAIGVPAEAMVTGRYHTPGGGFVSGGLGVGVGLGAGASPVRFVLGGGFGTGREVVSKDRDGDGIVGASDVCPDEPETTNAYRDTDGCADVLPGLAFVASDAEAVIVVTRPDGSTLEGKGRVAVTGLPEQQYTASARGGSCSGGKVTRQIPSEGEATIDIALGRLDGTVSVTVIDTAGRPLDGALIRYMLDDEACAPADSTLNGGRGVHKVGAGDVRVLVTAPGYNVHQEQFPLEYDGTKAVEAKLAATQVTVRDGALKLSVPIVFADSRVEDRSAPLLQQIATVAMTQQLRFEITGFADAKGGKSLALARAEAVKSQLAMLGVPLASMTTASKTPVPGGQKDLVTFKVLTP